MPRILIAITDSWLSNSTTLVKTLNVRLKHMVAYSLGFDSC